MTTEPGMAAIHCGRQIRVDEGGGAAEERTLAASSAIQSQNAANSEKESRLQQQHYSTTLSTSKNDHFSDGDDEGDNSDDDDDQYEQAMDIFVKHFDQQQQHNSNGSRMRERRPSLPTEDIELATFSGVVMRRKQELQMKFNPPQQMRHQTNDNDNEKQEQQQQQQQQHHLLPVKSTKNNRPLSISSISSAASSGSNVSSNSSSSSGIHSSLTRNSSLNYSQEFRAQYSYLQSVESLNSQGSQQQRQTSQDGDKSVSSANNTSASSSVIEEALKNLNLSSKDNNLAQTRAAILAAGQLQRRSFNIHQGTSLPGGDSKLSRINRSFHASLRYDKSTACRIHLMANARAFGLGGQTKSYNLGNHSGIGESSFEPRGIFRRYSTISRNNSSTSSDSGNGSGAHLLSPCRCGARNLKFSKDNNSSTGCSSVSLASSGGEGISNGASSSSNQDESGTTTAAAARKLFNNKAATLDGAACGRMAPGNDGYKHHHPTCPSYSPAQSMAATSSATSSQRPLRASPKLQQSPSSVSSYSNTSSLFRDDGFEDDLTSTTSEHSSLRHQKIYHNLRSSSSTQQQHQNDTQSINISSNNSANINFHRHRIHNEQELPLLNICQRVVTEIIETERSYVDDLEQIVSGYLCRLRDLLDQHQELFSNLEDIYKFNKDFLFQLEECYLNPGTIAACFVENASKFGVYTHYCTQYPQVVSTLTELMAQPATAQLLKERQLELNQSLPLGAYLLKPVQRILKYHILFKSLIKHAADDDTVNEKDLESINEAISVMTNIASHINEMKKRHEHSIRVQELQSLLCGWEGPDLTTLGELILEDTFKLFNRQKSSRHLLLFDNVLLITKKRHDGSLQYKGHIECSNLMLIEAIEGQPLVFNTVPFDNPKALCAFQANNLEKKRDWCLQMKEVIIKSFEVKIPVHVRDLLMSLTKTNTATTTNPKGTSNSKKSSSSEKALRAPDYLEKKRSKQQQDKLNNSKTKR